MAHKLLLVDDDRFILNALSKTLSSHGFHCTIAVNGVDAMRALSEEEFDLMLLDLSLPDIDGLSLCRRIRTKFRLPILMVTARDDVSTKIVGLEIGADDYITKPFDPLELVARVRSHIRRTAEYSEPTAEDRRILVGRIVVDEDARDAYLANHPAGLTDKEFELLLVLARNCGRALAHDWLYEKVWGYDAELGGKTLAVYIRRLRRKVEQDPDNPIYIRTVRGFGYRMVSNPDEEP